VVPKKRREIPRYIDTEVTVFSYLITRASLMKLERRLQYGLRSLYERYHSVLSTTLRIVSLLFWCGYTSHFSTVRYSDTLNHSTQHAMAILAFAVWRPTGSAVLSDFAAPLQDLSCGPGCRPTLFGERQGSDLKEILAQNCAFWSSVTLTHKQTVQNSFKFSLKILCPLEAPCKVCGPPAIASAAGP